MLRLRNTDAARVVATHQSAPFSGTKHGIFRHQARRKWGQIPASRAPHFPLPRTKLDTVGPHARVTQTSLATTLVPPDSDPRLTAVAVGAPIATDYQLGTAIGNDYRRSDPCSGKDHQGRDLGAGLRPASQPAASHPATTVYDGLRQPNNPQC